MATPVNLYMYVCTCFPAPLLSCLRRCSIMGVPAFVHCPQKLLCLLSWGSYICGTKQLKMYFYICEMQALYNSCCFCA